MENETEQHTGEIEDDVIHIQPSAEGEKLQTFNQKKQRNCP